MKTNKFLSKFLLTLTALLVTSVYAIPRGPCNQPKDVCCEDPSPGPFAFSYPKDIGLSCPRDFYIHGEFMWMKPSEEGLEYVIERTDSGSATFPLAGGKIDGFSRDSDEWDWRPGFRIGFGFYPMHDAWNVSVDWTYFRMKSDSAVSVGTNRVMRGMFVPAVSTTYALFNASARWSGDYNTVDLMVGKPYHVSRYYISNPMFGIRTAWIDQDYHIRYVIANANVWLKNDYYGIGFRGLYEGQFLISAGWSFYGKIALSILYGKFDVSQSFEATSSPTVYQTENSFYCVQPNAELGLGISWSNFYHKNQYHISVKVGYEFHHWWDQNQARRFFDTDPAANDTVSRGDLSFNGFMFGLNLEF